MPWGSDVVDQYRDVSDEELDLALQLGEFIQSRADDKGLGLRSLSNGEDWMRLVPEIIIGDLCFSDGNQNVKLLLKDVRNQINRGKFPGSKRQSLDIISRLMRTLGKGNKPHQLPKIPQRVAVSVSR